MFVCFGCLEMLPSLFLTSKHGLQEGDSTFFHELQTNIFCKYALPGIEITKQGGNVVFVNTTGVWDCWFKN